MDIPGIELLYRVPTSKLGQSHANVDSFRQAVRNQGYCPSTATEFCVVVVTASPCHILLGHENHDGIDVFSCFRSSIDFDTKPEDSAIRSLQERTNIHIPSDTMRSSKVGVLRYTFEGDPLERIMHVYRIHMPSKECTEYINIQQQGKGFSTVWFDDWEIIPLKYMSADHSHWLVTLLSKQYPSQSMMDGRFHFGIIDKNVYSILHYALLDIPEVQDLTLHPNNVQDDGTIVETKETQHRFTSFRNRLPESRLGKSHSDIHSFLQASSNHHYCPTNIKEFTLVVVTAGPRHILLGHKNRGIGKGMYNSFGGKFDPEELVEDCASRELSEETNIHIPPSTMAKNKVGILRFSSEGDSLEMVVHVFRIHMDRKDCPAYSDIRPCEEMTPKWFDDWYDIPLDNMFADDSRWLVTLLSSDRPLEIDGSFHFQKDVETTNTILHYYMDIREKPRFTIEQRLFHAIHDNKIHSPTIKEFKECYAFQNIVRRAFSSQGKRKLEWDIIIDVAGGHGALAALFLTFTNAHTAIVVDPAVVGGGGVTRAWKRDFFSNKILHYRTECLRTGLPAELEAQLKRTTPDRILVVACHACQHLSEETLEIACRYGVHAVVMPCCQKDHSEGSAWKYTSQQLAIPIGQTMDLLLAGKMMASKSHIVSVKLMDPKITPQNRIIICQALHGNHADHRRISSIEAAHTKLTRAYLRAHHEQEHRNGETRKGFIAYEFLTPVLFLGMGFLAGCLTNFSFRGAAIKDARL